MWIVRLALRRPYTFVVAALLVLILGVYTIVNTPTDIFPDINIPVISVIFSYSGMSPDDMEKHIVTGFERILTTTVNDLEHTESQSLYGIATVKIYFQPNAKIETALAQVTAIAKRRSVRCRRARNPRWLFSTALRTCRFCSSLSPAIRCLNRECSTRPATLFVRGWSRCPGFRFLRLRR